MKGFLMLALEILLGVLVIVTGFKVFGVSFQFGSDRLHKVSENSSVSAKEQINDLNGYEKPIPVTTVYALLKNNEGYIDELHFTYIAANNVSKTVDYIYGNRIKKSDGTILDTEESRDYVVEQLKYLFNTKMLVKAEYIEDSSTYKITLTQYDDHHSRTGV